MSEPMLTIIAGLWRVDEGAPAARRRVSPASRVIQSPKVVADVISGCRAALWLRTMIRYETDIKLSEELSSPRCGRVKLFVFRRQRILRFQ